MCDHHDDEEEGGLSRTKSTELYYGNENKHKEDLLFPLILKYYENNPYIDVVFQMVHRTGSSTSSTTSKKKRRKSEPAEPSLQISLRKLDSIVSKKKKKTKQNKKEGESSPPNLYYFLEIKNSNTNRDRATLADEKQYRLDPDKSYAPFNLLASYHKMLHHHQKRYFDGFRRRTRITQQTTTGVEFTTSYCQLNFFIWVDQFQLCKHVPEMMDLLKKQEEHAASSNNKAVAVPSFVLFDYPQYVAVPPMHVFADCQLYYPTITEEDKIMEHIFYIKQTKPLFSLLSRSQAPLDRSLSRQQSPADEALLYI